MKDVKWLAGELMKENIEISEIVIHDEEKFAWLVDPEGT